MKRILCVLLAVLLLAGCGAPAGAGDAAGKGSQLTAKVNGKSLTYQAWEKAGLPGSGSYYLTKDVQLDAPVQVDGSLNLHLNGHKVSGVEGGGFDGSLFRVSQGASLTIYDEPEAAGCVVSPRSFNGAPIIISMFQVAGTLTIAGGLVDASGVGLEDVGDGACVYVCDGGVLNITGGTLVGGSTMCTDIVAPPAPAEGEEPQEEWKPTGRGGTIFVQAGGTCNISGGTVKQGYAGLGGNIYVEAGEETPGALNITGGIITEGTTVFHGANIFDAGKMEMSAGEITLGQAYGSGGNMYITGTLEITGGSIREGKCDVNMKQSKRGGNIAINGTNAVVHIANVELIGGDSSGQENYGGNISIFSYGAREFTLKDSTLTGGLGHRGGNFYIGHLSKAIDPENLDYTITNVTMSEGATTYRGTNICVDTKDESKPIILTLNDCHLLADERSNSDNLAVGAGANDDTRCHVTMNGGSIFGGVLTIYGNGSLTTNGTECTQTNHAWGGEWFQNP